MNKYHIIARADHPKDNIWERYNWANFVLLNDSGKVIACSARKGVIHDYIKQLENPEDWTDQRDLEYDRAHPSPAIKELLKFAVQELNDKFSYAGCNDFDLPNTPEMHKLIQEFNDYNVGEKNHNHDESMKGEIRGDKILFHDSILIYLLQKHLGLLD